MPVLQVRITDEQEAEIRTAAEAAGLKVSEYVRQVVLDPEGQDADGAAFRAAVADHERRLGELEAWHERSKVERAAWEARGWVSPTVDGRDRVPMKLRPAASLKPPPKIAPRS